MLTRVMRKIGRFDAARKKRLASQSHVCGHHDHVVLWTAAMMALRSVTTWFEVPCENDRYGRAITGSKRSFSVYSRNVVIVLCYYRKHRLDGLSRLLLGLR